MPTTLSLDRHISAIGASADVLIEAARGAGLDAPVPTCPEWDVRALVTHVGMVHRWAAANLRGEKDHRSASSTEQAAAAVDLLEWFGVGVRSLLTTIRDAPDDVEALVFLNDAPAPRRFWARRQAHETTIHSVDAVAARLGKWPAVAAVDVPAELAADGLDELLCGFITRGKSKLRAGTPYTIAVTPDDVEHAWEVAVGTGPPVTTPGPAERADATFSGSAAQLYLSLWNRSKEIVTRGRPGALETWRRDVIVTWS